MKKILIVVDMQNDFIDGSLGTTEAQAIVKKAAEKIKSFEGEIIVTLDTHFENYMETSEGKKLPVPHCIRGTAGHRLNHKIENALSGKSYTTVEKLTFGSKELPKTVEAIVSDEEYTVEMIGLCTDICVISNALLLKAFNPEIEITVISDICAGVTPAKHLAALETMKSCQINVIKEGASL